MPMPLGAPPIGKPDPFSSLVDDFMKWREQGFVEAEQARAQRDAAVQVFIAGTGSLADAPVDPNVMGMGVGNIGEGLPAGLRSLIDLATTKMGQGEPMSSAYLLTDPSKLSGRSPEIGKGFGAASTAKELIDHLSKLQTDFLDPIYNRIATENKAGTTKGTEDIAKFAAEQRAKLGLSPKLEMPFSDAAMSPTKPGVRGRNQGLLKKIDEINAKRKTAEAGKSFKPVSDSAIGMAIDIATGSERKMVGKANFGGAKLTDAQRQAVIKDLKGGPSASRLKMDLSQYSDDGLVALWSSEKVGVPLRHEAVIGLMDDLTRLYGIPAADAAKQAFSAFVKHEQAMAAGKPGDPMVQGALLRAAAVMKQRFGLTAPGGPSSLKK